MRSVGGAGPTWTNNEKRRVFGTFSRLNFSRVDGVPFKVTLLNTPHLLRKAARFARARFARASRAFYLVKSISPRDWGQVSLRSGRAFFAVFKRTYPWEFADCFYLIYVLDWGFGNSP